MFNKSLKEHSNFQSKKEFNGVNHCNSYCLISSADAKSKNATEQYRTSLERLNKSVDVLYFQNDKSESENGYSKQHVKWNGVPQNEAIDSVLSKEYDVLIFLHPSMENHLKYIAILCNAKFKIGPAFEDCTHIFDLMIEADEYSNTEKLIKSINQQLKLISA